MNERLKIDIHWMVSEAYDRIEKLRAVIGNAELEKILGDQSLKWVRSRKCPKKHALAVAEAVGFVHGAARALGIMPSDLATQLLDQDERQDAAVLGLVAHSAIRLLPNMTK